MIALLLSLLCSTAGAATPAESFEAQVASITAAFDDDEFISEAELKARMAAMRPKLAAKHGVAVEDVSAGEVVQVPVRTPFGMIPLPHFRYEFKKQTLDGKLTYRYVGGVYEDDPAGYKLDDVRGIRVGPVVR